MDSLPTPLWSILASLPIAAYLTDVDGWITAYNEAAVELAGRQPEIGKDRWCVVRTSDCDDQLPAPGAKSALATAMSEGRPIHAAETVVERPDGRRFPLRAYHTPLFDSAGKLSGSINILMPGTARMPADAESSLLAAIVASSDDVIVSKTLDGVVTSWNASATRIFGYTEAEMIGASIRRIIPPDLYGEEDQIIARLRKGEHIDHFETVRVAKDGRRVDISLTVSPVRDGSGRIVGASKVARDITEKKQAERDKELLLHELNHRVKNTLATVQAIASQTLRHAGSQDEFSASFSGRLNAMARMHEVLTQNTWHGAELSSLVQGQVLVVGSEEDRVSYGGPAVWLGPQDALHLALVLYELGTNARKYGALSVPSGRLSIEWQLLSGDDPRLQLHWRETGGPEVLAPTKTGFGTRLIEQSLRAQRGESSLRYGTAGLECDITLPLPDQSALSRDKASVAARRVSVTSEATGRSILAGKRVLVIEDEPLVAMEIEEALLEKGCKVIGPAGNLETATSLIETAAIDACLLDANLGGASVDSLAEGLKRRNIPFAFATGYGRSALPAAFRGQPMLAKPFTQTELTNLVGVLVSTRAAGNQLG